MVDFFIWLFSIFGGVFGALIGIITIAGVAVFLITPYLLMTQKPRELRDEESQHKIETQAGLR